jgi:PAS domain S-box-containing protein
MRVINHLMIALISLHGIAHAAEPGSVVVSTVVPEWLWVMLVLLGTATVVATVVAVTLFRKLNARAGASSPAEDLPAGRAVTPPAVVAKRKAEATDRTTEALIRQGLPAARLGSWDNDLRQNRLTWSPHVHEIFGRKPKDMPTNFDDMLLCVHPEDRPLVAQMGKRLRETRGPVSWEVRIIWPDTSIHWHACRAESVPGEDGSATRVTGIAMDITERKQMEEELRQNQRLLRAGFTAAGMGAWEWDQRSGQVTWSGQVESLFDIPAGSFVGTFEAFIQLIHPDDQAMMMAAVTRAMEEGGAFQVEHRIRTSDGRVRWLAGRGDVVRGKDGISTGMAGVVMDITSRRLAEQELRDSEERYRTVINAMSEGVVVHQADGRIIDSNQSAQLILGLTAAQMVGRDNFDPRWRTVRPDGSPFPPEEHPSALAQRTGKPQHDVVMGVHRPDDSLRWLSVNADPMFVLGGGSPIGTVATITDISQRLQHERALRDSEERLRSLAENNPHTIAMVDRTGTILYLNRALPGAEIRQILGANVRDYLDDSSLTGYLSRLEQIFTEGRAGEVESRIRAPDGHVMWLLNAMGPLRSGGRIIAAVVTSMDITDRRRDQEERQRLLMEREQMFDRMPIGCILWTADRKISYVNPAAEQIFGHKAAGMIGQGPELLTYEDSLPEVLTYFERVEQGDMGLVAEMTNRNAADKDIICEWHPTPLFGADGKLTGIITMVMDISERSSLEEQLRQSQKMEAVGRLAGGIAHDFNNLLTAIMGYGELLESRIVSADPSSGHIKQIKKAAKRAAALTYQLLAFSRKQVLQSQLLVLDDVITDLAPMLRRLIGEHITLNTDLQSTPWQVLADVSQIEQVVMNLVVNSRDAMPRGGSLTISTRNRSLDADMVRAYAEVQPGDYVMMVVSDNGEGMEPDIRKRIFEPFFTTKSEGKGTGLGLAVVFGVVRQSGGFIFVDSVPGKGSRFDVLLPRADKAPEPFRHRDSTAQLAIRGTETILLVEDDEGVRSLLKDTLECSGYTVIAASFGEEAIELSATHPTAIDLLLTDVVMPGLGGREVAEKIQQQRPAIKVLFMSGYTDDLVLAHGVAQGNAAFIEKPFAAPKLLGRIRKVLSGQS